MVVAPVPEGLTLASETGTGAWACLVKPAGLLRNYERTYVTCNTIDSKLA